MLELRQANPRRQGDIGEAAAIAWLTRAGYGVWIPLGHSPDVDLIAQKDDRLFRVQVKTSTAWRNDRYEVSLATKGGNQSWSGRVKTIDPGALRVSVRTRRRWPPVVHPVHRDRGEDDAPARLDRNTRPSR
jgi:PD-(D/E)XK endonuclease